MNIYDRNQMQGIQYSFAKESKTFSKRAARDKVIFLVLIILVAVVTIAFLFRNDVFCRTFLAYVLVLLGMLSIYTGMSYRRMYQALRISPRVLHDYYYKAYLKTKKERVRNNMLIILAKCDIQMENFADAANALGMVNYYAMPLVTQASCHLQWAIINILSGNREGYEQNVDTYRSMCASRKEGLPKCGERLQILYSGNREEIKGLSDTTEALKLNSQSFYYRGFLLLFVAAFILLFAGFDLMSPGIEYRNWFVISVTVVTEIGVLVMAVLLMRTALAIRRYNGASTTGPLIVRVILIIITVLVLTIFDLGELFMRESYETKLSDDCILVTHPNFLDANNYYVVKPYRVIFRQYLYDSDGDGAPLSENEADEEEADDYADVFGATGLYQKIYDTQFADTEHGTGFQICISAKGNPYALVGEPFQKEFMGETVSAQIRLVYDRESENGLCDEVVCYEDHYDESGNQLDNTSILEFYAIVKQSGEVIPGDKTGWAELGNEAYRDATGE